MAARLAGVVSAWKIGLGLLHDGGLGLAAELKAGGADVFLDMKLFDIPATVERAARGLAATIGPDLLTVHGDPYVVRAAVEGRGAAPVSPRLLLVVLVSMRMRSA